MKQSILTIAAALLLSASMLEAQGAENQQSSNVIENPMLWADVPDPDVIRVGDTFYLVSTTMHLMPGAPVMASKDLKNWETVGYIFDRLTDSPKYDLQEGTVYGRGQWATSLKYHDGRFWALFAPNEGGPMGDTYICTAPKAEGPWTIHSRLRHFHKGAEKIEARQSGFAPLEGKGNASPLLYGGKGAVNQLFRRFQRHHALVFFPPVLRFIRVEAVGAAHIAQAGGGLNEQRHVFHPFFPRILQK